MGMDKLDMPLSVQLRRLDAQAEAARWIELQDMGRDARPEWLAFLRWWNAWRKAQPQQESGGRLGGP